MTKRLTIALLPALLGAAIALTPTTADAFCGFYVSGATGELYNDATQVVMMREGTRTVLSMQNNYQGPPENFAMVVPVPVVLQKENVKTLDRAVFTKVDQMAAPRLVEYWETDPCYVEPPRRYRGAPGSPVATKSSDAKKEVGNGVTIEAQFKVGEYEVVVLSAKDSGGLDTWLRANKYNIPAGAEPVLRPYVEAGTKFFVAKVDVTKVKFNGNQAVLSPLRFHYDSKAFSLPIRLGLLNAKGHQDVIVHILARSQRYEVANYKNTTIPTNLIVDNEVRERFAEFYAALFDETVAQNPKSVITEYSWDASTCDPCPGPTLNQADMMTLGADAMPSKQAWGYVLTRLHARYTKETLGEDLVFRAAAPIVGGRGTPNRQGELDEKGSKPGGVNNFQGRYAILHPWEGEIACQTPQRGRWGGPPKGKSGGTQAASDLAGAKRGGVKLTKLVRQDVPDLKLKTANAQPKLGDEKPKSAPASNAKNPGQEPENAPASAAADLGTDGSDKTPPDEAEGGFGCSQGGLPTGGAAALFLAVLAIAIKRRF